MTPQEFDKLKFSAGMRISHTCTMTAQVRVFDVVSVNFAEQLFGVEDNDTCDCCDAPILTWFRCENCELLTEK